MSNAPLPANQKLGCDYQGHEFGACYPDSVCIEGYLWDADSGDSDGLTHGGDLPCPKCNRAEWREYHADSVVDEAYVALSSKEWPFRRVKRGNALWGFWNQVIGASAFAWDLVRGRT